MLSGQLSRSAEPLGGARRRGEDLLAELRLAALREAVRRAVDVDRRDDLAGGIGDAARPRS